MPAHGRPDEELIELFQNGDREAFSHIVRRYQANLANFFYHLCYDRATAEDLTQEVFVRLFQHLGGYEPRSKFVSFLYKIAKNLWIDRIRRTAGAHKKEISIETPLGGEDSDSPSLKDRLRTGEDAPSEFLLRDEVRSMVRKALDRLPEEHRMVVILSEIHGMRYEEISEALGIPIGTVKSRMHHAMGRLKEILKNVYP
ncbi:MAG TPA: sigma-70 family RNA polymerase sigma factor [Planctomycetota bacterium]|nr:sigma-70 family RNA polymerase sigma factor [Planctomycetota bacterium]